MRRLVTIFLVVWSLGLPQLWAQAEHVPARHPVMDFLGRMQVRGVVREFSPNLLPLDRADVVALLRKVRDAGLVYSETDAALLSRYLDEFVRESEGTSRPAVLLATGAEAERSGVCDDAEKYLITAATADRQSTLYAEALASLEHRMLLRDGDRAGVTLGQVGGRFRGTLGGFVGYGLQATNGESFGDKSVALMDTWLRQNVNFNDLDRDFFDFTEAYVGARWSWGSASLGRETVLAGTGLGGRTIFGGTAQNFDAIRLHVHFGGLRFWFLHGSLLGERDTVENFRPAFGDKYVAMHRLEGDLAGVVRLGVTEAVVYSERTFDFRYLNPVNFFKSAEHSGGDRDNPLLGFDMTTLFLPGLQAHVAWLIDDVDFAKLGTDWFGNKFAWQFGMVSTWGGDGDVALEYTRVEPYTFSHVFRNNEYTNGGVLLGLDQPPNSDLWMLRYRHWFGARTSVQMVLRHMRHGRNEVAADGTLLVNHGGDLRDRYVGGRDSQTAPFLEGPRETLSTVSLRVQVEPIRKLVFEAGWEFQRHRMPGAEGRDSHLFSLAGRWCW